MDHFAAVRNINIFAGQIVLEIVKEGNIGRSNVGRVLKLESLLNFFTSLTLLDLRYIEL